MTALLKVGTVNLNTSTGNQSVTGVGFQPKFVLFKIVAITGAAVNPHNADSFGLAISSSAQRSMTWSSESGVGNSVCRRGWSDTRCFYGLYRGTSTLDYAAEFVSQDSDGFTFNITTAPPSGYTLQYMAFGGTDITSVEEGNFDLATGTGDQAVTGLSAKPDFLLLFGTLGTAASNATNGDIANMLGFASGPDNEGCSSWSENNAQVTSENDRYQRSDNVIALIDDTGAEYARANLKSFDSAGFTVTKSVAPSSATRISYLAVTGGGWFVDKFLSQSSTGNFNVTGLGITPIGTFFQSVNLPTQTTPNVHRFFQVGMGQSSSVRYMKGSIGKDAVGTTACFDYSNQTRIYATYDVDQVFDASIDLVSFSSGSMTLNQIDAEPDEQKEILFFVFGEAVGLSITPNSIVSAEAFGSPTIIIDQFITPNGIASAEAFGSPTIIIDQFITPNSIVSAEAFGSPNITIPQIVDPVGIISAEIFGIPSLLYDQIITPSGIASEEAFGSPIVNAMQTITPNGIASAEAWGLPNLTRQFLNVYSILSAEAFGLPVLDLVIYMSGIASEEAFGSPTIGIGSAYIFPNSIVSAEAFGLIEKINLEILVTGISSEEAFGSPSISTGNVFIQANSIVSAEAFGQPSVHPGITISPNSIESSEAFGVPHVVPGGHSIVCIGIPSEEAFGTPGVIVGGATIAPNSIDSSEAFGAPTLVPQFVSVHPIGIESQEAFGAPVMTTGNVSISVNSIDSSEAFGTPSLSPGNVFFSPLSITSEEAFGAPSLSVGAVDITPNSIPPSEAWGLPNISISINPNSILSEEAFGSPNISTGNVNINLIGIPSEEGFGEPIVRNVLVIEGPVGIVSGEAFGLPTIFLRVLSPFQEQMETDLDEVFFTDDDFEFAEYAVFTYDTGEVIQLKVIFDHAYEEVTPGGAGAMVQSRNPMVQCQTSVFTRRPRKGCKLQVRGTNYEVMSYEPDGTGVSILMLHHEKTI